MLNFLSQIKIEDPGTTRKTGGGGRRKAWNPESGLKIRVWKDGSIFPSQELTDKFELEYRNRPAEDASVTGRGLDIFSSLNFPIVKTPVPVIFVNVVKKSANRIDAFGTVTYNEDGTPKTTVMDQGSNTFGRENLIPMLTTLYNIELSEEKPYVDLVFLGQDGEAAQQPFGLPNGKTVCGIPKEIARGDRKGEISSVRRENPELYVLYPVPLMEGGSDADLDAADQSATDAELGHEQAPAAAWDTQN